MSQCLTGDRMRTWNARDCRVLLLLLILLGLASASASAHAASTSYKITVKTADESEAGTDSNIYLRMIGTEGESAEYRLNKHLSGNAFERGDKDRCTLKLSTNIGPVYRIKLRSDGKYGGSDWRLNYVKIEGGGRTSTFPFYRWIKRKSYEKTCADFGLEAEGAARSETVHLPKAMVLDGVNGSATSQPYRIQIHDEETFAISSKATSSSKRSVGGSWESPETAFGSFSTSVQATYEQSLERDRSEAKKTVTDMLPTNQVYGAAAGTCLVVLNTWAFRYRHQDYRDWLGGAYESRALTDARSVSGVTTLLFEPGTRRSREDWNDVAWAVYDAIGDWGYGRLVRKLQEKGMLEGSVPTTAPRCPYAD